MSSGKPTPARPSPYRPRNGKAVSKSADIGNKIKHLNMLIKLHSDEIEQLRKSCPHARTKYHPRQIAEDDPWTECLDCGSEVGFGVTVELDLKVQQPRRHGIIRLGK